MSHPARSEVRGNAGVQGGGKMSELTKLKERIEGTYELLDTVCAAIDTVRKELQTLSKELEQLDEATETLCGIKNPMCYG
jgi:archaellum component FlaC